MCSFVSDRAETAASFAHWADRRMVLRGIVPGRGGYGFLLQRLWSRTEDRILQLISVPAKHYTCHRLLGRPWAAHLEFLLS